MPLPVLAVFGATGRQGASVIENAPKSLHQIRAVTRDPTSKAAKALGVEVVKADTSDEESLKNALRGVSAVFLMTNPSLEQGGDQVEFESGKNVVDAAIEAGVDLIIFSTLPSASAISSGKYSGLNNYEGKHKIETYIRSQPCKSAFVAAGFFMENFSFMPCLPPVKRGDRWVLEGLGGPEARFPLIATTLDYGKWVARILTEPEKYAGKTLWAAERQYTMTEIAEVMSSSSGKEMSYEQISKEAFAKRTGGIDFIVEEFGFIADFGCWGRDEESLLAQSAEHHDGKLTTFEAYLKQHPLQLEG